MANTERRRTTRHTIRLKIPCSAKRIVQEDSSPVRVRSLSPEWVKFAAATAFPPGLHLTLDLPGLADSKLMRVVAVDPQDDSEQVLVLAHFVKKLTRGDLDILRAKVQEGKKRKTSLRRPGTLKGTCHRIRITEDGPWLVTAYNVSGRGIGMWADRPIEPGTFLKLEMPSVNRKRLHAKLMRVTRSRFQGEEWDLGGVFLKELSDDEVKALL
jgi:hypothetical protein